MEENNIKAPVEEREQTAEELNELLVDFTRREGRCRQQRQHHAA